MIQALFTSPSLLQDHNLPRSYSITVSGHSADPGPHNALVFLTLTWKDLDCQIQHQHKLEQPLKQAPILTKEEPLGRKSGHLKWWFWNVTAKRHHLGSLYDSQCLDRRPTQLEPNLWRWSQDWHFWSLPGDAIVPPILSQCSKAALMKF